MNASVASLNLSSTMLEEIALDASNLVKVLGMALDKVTEDKLSVRQDIAQEESASNVLLFDDIDGPLVLW